MEKRMLRARRHASLQNYGMVGMEGIPFCELPQLLDHDDDFTRSTNGELLPNKMNLNHLGNQFLSNWYC